MYLLFYSSSSTLMGWLVAGFSIIVGLIGFVALYKLVTDFLKARKLKKEQDTQAENEVTVTTDFN